MAILNVLTETTGLVGVVPRTIYIQTSNSSTEIEATGFLDGIVREGIALFQTDIAHVTFSNAPFVAAYNVVLAAGQWSLVPLVPPPAPLAWSILGNSDVSEVSSFLGSTVPVDVIVKADSTTVVSLLAASGSTRFANNGTVDGLFPTAVLSSDNSAGSLSLYGGPLQTGAQLTVTGPSNIEPSIVGHVGNASFFTNSIGTGFYALISPPGIQIGENSGFGDATQGVLALSRQTVNPTTIPDGGMVFVGTDENLYYLNTSGTFQLTATGGEFWSTAGNTITGGLLGTTSADSFSIITNSVPIYTFDASQNVTVAATTWNLTTTSSIQIISSFGGGTGFIIDPSGNLSFGSAASTTASSGTTMSFSSGTDLLLAAGGVLGTSGTLGTTFLDAAFLTVDAPQVNIGPTSATSINMGSTAVTFNHNSSTSEFNSNTTFAIQSGTDMQIETTDGNLMIVAAGTTNNLTLESLNSQILINGNMNVTVTSPSIVLSGALNAPSVTLASGANGGAMLASPPTGYNFLVIDGSGNIRYWVPA